MSESTPVSRVLTRFGIPHREFTHPGPIHSLKQAADERGQIPEQIVRSIVFRIGKGEFAMVLVAGPNQVSWPALRSRLGQSRLTMASDDEVLAATGYQPGSVSPFGLPAPLRILVDENVFVHEEISIGSGVKGTTIIMKSADLKVALGKIELGIFT